MYGEQVVFFDIHVPQNIQFNISTQDTQSDEQTTENEIISFDDISANINQIKSYIAVSYTHLIFTGFYIFSDCVSTRCQS